LISLGVIGVADIATDRQFEKLAAKMVLETRANDLLAVVKIFGANEPYDRVDEQRRELARYRVGARFESLLVDATTRVRRERRTLSGLEIHHILAERARRFNERAISRPSFKIERSMPNERFAASLPAID
jgi:hypothetical protein